MLRALVSCFVAFTAISALQAGSWAVARDPYFEVFAQAGRPRAETTLAEFEKLRAFFAGNRLIRETAAKTPAAPMRVIEFQTRADYESYRVRATADAFFLGSPERNYIVMPQFGAGDFSVAAHEYAHAALRSNGLNLPPWLSEGMAELFSTVRITDTRTTLGGPIPSRLQTLRKRTWIPLNVIIDPKSGASLRDSPRDADLFYAESWALVDWLAGTPERAELLPRLLSLLGTSQTSTEQALKEVYDTSLQEISASIRARLGSRTTAWREPLTLPPSTTAISSRLLTDFETGVMTADLLVAVGQIGRAQALYEHLLETSPQNAEVEAALGTVLLRQGERPAAADLWKRAMDHGLADAALCYRFALLAEDLNQPRQQIEETLERAVQVNPHFDDARYKLALLKSNNGDFEGAVKQLEAMSEPDARRAFGYWSAFSASLQEVGRREEAVRAAEKAQAAATTVEDRGRAASLVYQARTDLAVQFVQDPDGTTHLETTRIPHGTAHFNPFILPTDVIETVQGQLQEVRCTEGKLTGFVVRAGARVLSLGVTDPQRIMVQNGPNEFICGPQTPRSVTAEFARGRTNDSGVLRGLSF